MNIKFKCTGLQNAARFTGKFLEHHAPTIFVGLGIGGGIAAGVWACKNTLKLNDTMTDINTRLEAVHATAETVTPKEYRNELTKTYLYATWEIGKLYAGPIFLGASSVAAIMQGKRILDNRCASALNALSLSEQLFNKYRDRVREELGEEKDKEFRYGIREQIIEEIVTDKNGNPKTDKNGEVKTVKKKVRVVETEDVDFSRMFDEISSREHDRDVEYNIEQLTRRQNIHDDMLHSRNYICINEVYRDLGYPLVANGWDYGWIIMNEEDRSRIHVNYGMYDMNPETGLRPIDNMDQYNNAILLTFPGVTYIRDKIWKAQRIW